jgi:ParB-like chromosome segregation protein Spo0J
LADSIYKEGLMNPLIVMDSINDSGGDIIELVAGERRLRAIKHIRNTIETDFMDAVPCIQFEGGYHDAVFVQAAENIDREAVDDVDISAWIHQRCEDGVNQGEIASRIHKSLQYVSFRYNFYERAAAEVKEALRESLISFSAAYELTKNLSSDDQIKWINKARDLNKKISLADARVANTNKTTKPSKAQRDTLLARATRACEDRGSETARGMMLSLSWVDGLLDTEEMEHVIDKEEGK